MILQSEGEEEDIGFDASLPQALEDFPPATAATWAIPTAMREEEEEIIVPAEELDKASSTSSPISKHMGWLFEIHRILNIPNPPLLPRHSLQDFPQLAFPPFQS